MKFKLLTLNSQKMEKAKKFGYLNAILHLAPSKMSGFNVCPSATIECINLCLNTSGHGGMFKKGETTNVVQEARKRRTLYYFNDRTNFEADLISDIEKFVKTAKKNDLIPVVRVNGTSDIFNLAVKMANRFPDLQFVDYTKNLSSANKELPKNYSLTFSRSESNGEQVLKLIPRFNVAVVFNTKELPKTYKGFKVFDGDKSDLRHLDPKGVIVGLLPKGKAKKSNSPFMVTL